MSRNISVCTLTTSSLRLRSAQASVFCLGSVSVNTWYEVDVTSLVTGDGTYSFRISDSTGGADYSSKEGANAPQLVLTLGGTPAPTNTPTATSAATNTPTKTPTPGPSPTNTVAPTATATSPAQGVFSSAAFTYDGDGARVKSVVTTNLGTTTTFFVGNHYEVTGSTITKYYYAGSQRIAMRNNGTLSYLLGDHLGSTSLVTDATGYNAIETRYKAWGEVRYTSGTTPTKYTYTGQYSYTPDFGLMFYNARWYDPTLARFAQADTITPSGIQGYDRYAYVGNNPIRYNDPTGHKACDADDTGGCIVSSEPFTRGQAISRLRHYGVKLSGKVRESEVFAIFAAVDRVGAKFALAREIGESASEAFRAVYDHINIKWEGGAGTCGNATGVTNGGCTDSANQIRFWSLSGHGQNDMARMIKNVVHELGHAFDNALAYPDPNHPGQSLRPDNDMPDGITRDVLRPNPSDPEHWDWQQSPDNTGNEIFADMFIAWTYNTWNTNAANQKLVSVAQTWMNSLVP